MILFSLWDSQSMIPGHQIVQLGDLYNAEKYSNQT